MTPLINAFTKAWSRAFDYSGRSALGDYWWFLLADCIVLAVLKVMGVFVDFFGMFAHLYFIAQIVPHLSLTVRRLRDAGKAWSWIFIGLIPVIGAIWMMVLLAQPSLVA